MVTLAKQSLDGSILEGTLDQKLIYDLVETSVNEYLLNEHARRLMETAEPESCLTDLLKKLLTQLPTQKFRTEEQKLLQQYSTPPTIAFVAACVLSPRSTDIVLEPSAGTGSIAIWSKAIGAEVITNEISPRRLATLKFSEYYQTPNKTDWMTVKVSFVNGIHYGDQEFHIDYTCLREFICGWDEWIGVTSIVRIENSSYGE